MDPTKSPVRPLLRLPLPSLARLCVAPPVAAFAFCLAHAALLDAERANYTHCRVWNFAPSVSAAVGTSGLRSAAWRICLAVHAAPRLLVALMYRARRLEMASIAGGGRGAAVHLTFWVHLVELFGLLLLSMVSSKEHYIVRAKLS